MKKIFIAAGGTGGHIYPALALADEIRQRYPECDIVFTGSNDRMEKQLVPERGYRFIGQDLGILKGSRLHKAVSLLGYAKAEEKMRKLLKKEKPDACVGFGNYISIPLILAAKRLGIPTMIHEQNSYAGKANALLAKYCDAVVCCYDPQLSGFPAEKTKQLGNPEATVVSRRHPDRSVISEYGLDPELPYVLFMMGSLGSDSVSKVIDACCPMFDDSYQVLIVTGKAMSYEYTNLGYPGIRVTEYVNGGDMLRHAALAVTRAGATTISEITALGIPAVLVPSPYVPNNHQVYNARELADRDAAVMIEEGDLTAEVLAETVNALMKDDMRRETLGRNAALLGRPDAAAEMAEWLEEITRNE